MGERRRQRRARAATGPYRPSEPPQKVKPAKAPKRGRFRQVLRIARRSAGAIFSAIVAVVGLLGVYVLRPDVAVEPYATTDPTLPFREQFSVQNTSVYSIRRVQVGCGLDSVVAPGLNIHGLGIVMGNEQIDNLESGAKTTVTCGLSTGPIRQEMEIAPWVRYQTPFGFHRCKEAKFKGKTATEGTYIWTYAGSGRC
jgi:hypothetical protein